MITNFFILQRERKERREQGRKWEKGTLHK